MILNPTTIVTMDDWVAECIPVGKAHRRFVVGISPKELTEEQAFDMIDRLLKWRNVGPCDVTLKRRWQRQWQRRPTDPRLLARYR